MHAKAAAIVPNCTMAMITDSEGNILTLHQRKS
jgi:predicted enzyme related to lactoylglutathione lyase